MYRATSSIFPNGITHQSPFSQVLPFPQCTSLRKLLVCIEFEETRWQAMLTSHGNKGQQTPHHGSSQIIHKPCIVNMNLPSPGTRPIQIHSYGHSSYKKYHRKGRVKVFEAMDIDLKARSYGDEHCSPV
jgi:hypothetical protein